MCKPPKNGACKGARVRKRIRFKMIKGTQHKVCRQSYSMVDAGIRGMVGLITATNNELNLRAPCDKMEEEETRGALVAPVEHQDDEFNPS